MLTDLLNGELAIVTGGVSRTSPVFALGIPSTGALVAIADLHSERATAGLAFAMAAEIGITLGPAPFLIKGAAVIGRSMIDDDFPDRFTAGRLASRLAGAVMPVDGGS